MAKTPDRRPGESDEEGIILENRGAGDFPSETGGIRYVNGSFSFRDTYGLFNPRSATSAIGGIDTEIQYNNLGILSASSDFRYVRSTRSLVVPGISGSLTRLSSGDPYLRAAGNLLISTGSAGEIYLSTINSGTIHGVTALSGLLGGGNSGIVSLSIDDSVVATVSGTTFTGATKHVAGLSGSLTKLVNGSDYLVAGQGISLVTGSNGSITIINDGTVGDITSVNPGLGLKGGGSNGDVTLSIDDSVVATISGSTFTGAVKFNGGLSGSLTRLSNGSPYIVAGGNVSVITGSDGSLTFSTINSGTIHSVNPATGLKGGGSSGNISLSIDDSVVATVSGATFSGDVKFNGGLSGSLTNLSNGSPYLIAGNGINISTGTLGNVTITSTAVTSPAGSNAQIQFNDNSVFGASSDLTFNKITSALTSSYIVASSGFSGSLTRLSDGSSYLVAGNNISLTTSSKGSVTIGVVGISVAGSDTQVQFNDNGSYSGDPDFTFDKINKLLRVTNISGSITSSNLSSGQVALTAPGGVLSGSNNFYWSSEKLGIGTKNPDSVVHILGSNSTAAATLTVQQSTPNGIILDVKEDADKSALFVSGSGKVAIGSSSTPARFSVSGSSDSSTPILIVKPGANLSSVPVVDIQTPAGDTLFFVSGSGELGLGRNISSIQTSVVTTSTTSTTTLMSVSTSSFRSAEFIVQGTDMTGGKYSQTKILAVHNGSVSNHTIYGSVSIGSIAGTFDVTDPSGGSFSLRVTPTTTNSTVWKVTGILTRV